MEKYGKKIRPKFIYSQNPSKYFWDSSFWINFERINDCLEDEDFAPLDIAIEFSGNITVTDKVAKEIQIGYKNIDAYSDNTYKEISVFVTDDKENIKIKQTGEHSTFVIAGHYKKPVLCDDVKSLKEASRINYGYIEVYNTVNVLVWATSQTKFRGLLIINKIYCLMCEKISGFKKTWENKYPKLYQKGFIAYYIDYVFNIKYLKL